MKEEEKVRLGAMWEIEHEKMKEGYRLIAGVDEAGRGPLAGPVYTAAVILPPDIEIEGLNDSKKISEKKRDALFDIICEKAVAYSIASASVEEIDTLNIRNATCLAMNRAVEGLSLPPDFVLVDGNYIANCKFPSECVIKGDARSASIAAASILAKVSRDRLLLSLAEEYPEYGFEKHKGYGTKVHNEAILKYGPLPIHRKTFLKKLLGEEK